MLLKSEIITQASGSIGGATYAHNRGGLYRRARTIPVDPASASQVLLRGFLASLSTAWSATLTEPQREGWRTYSLAVPLPGPLGTLRDVGGIGMYQRCNVPRLRAGLARIDTAPAVLNEGEAVVSPAATATVIGGVSMAFQNPGASVGSLLVQQGRITNAGVLFFKGPFRFAGVESPPLTPFVIAFAALPFPFVAGQRTWWRVRYSHTDGRLGPASIVSSVAA